ncbi:MAG: CoA transferase [Nitriliruptorales bacterium]|nr:CoA transferase [Nitriliruptorales bacterium]
MADAMLAGVRVLELGQVIAGNYAGIILADMGADVVKIEPPRGDAARNPAIAPLRGESAIHLFMNRGKRSVGLDLKNPEGLDLFRRLVAHADIVIDNFRPGVMARLGIDHDGLAAVKRDIISCTITGFGETGPSKDRPAFDLVVQAYSGHLHITGDPEGPPARVGVPLADIAGGLYACMGILGALVGKLLHGTGQHIDVAMLDSLVSMLSYDGLHHLNSGTDVNRHGTAHAYMVPWQAFAVSDGYIVIAAREEKFWLRLCDAIDRPDLKEDIRTADNLSRVANRLFTVGVLEGAFLTKSKSEWMAILDDYDIPAAPVNDLPAVFSDPQVLARGLVQTYEHPTLGAIRYVPSPMQFSGWRMPNRTAPMLGQHTREVLADQLGLSDVDVDHLAEKGVAKVWPSTAVDVAS